MVDLYEIFRKGWSN